MKRLLTFLIVILSFQSASYATHTYGGEIGWTCLPNGRYQFYMSFFRDCSGIPWGFQSEVINIVGSPLPTDATGSTISTINLAPDSARWEAERQGDSAPRCTDQYGSPLSCGDGDNGIIQEFFYLSSPITLAGTPPRSGWRFYWTRSCCRPGNLENVITNVAGITNSVVLRAEMLPTRNGDDVNPCIDSSPEFRALPVSAICRGYEFTYNTTAIDHDLDSITYDFATAINPPIIQPNPVPYKTGYNFNNPTPDKTFDIRNIPSTLSRTAGTVKLAIYSGAGVSKYLTVIRATSWRDGVPNARIYRELPLSVFDCPALPSGFVNQPPKILIEGENASTVQILATAGQEVRRSVEIKDLDQAVPPGTGNPLQVVTLVPDGLMFSRDRRNPLPCQINTGLVDPCAILTKQTPFLDTDEDPPVYKIQGLGGVSTEFVWQTDCRHVQTKTGVPGTRAGIYNFVMRVTDDHCPIPSINYPTISVKVVDPITLSEPIVKGLSVGLDGKLTYQWASPLDSADTFEKYIVDYAIVQDGFTPTIWSEINDNLKIYHYFQKYNDDPSVYLPVGNIAGNPSNILRKNNGPTGNGFDWYMRMTTVSGCEDTSKSDPSEAVRVIELETEPAGTFPAPLKGGAELTWNRPKPTNASTKPYFRYESPTWYYIWENDSVGKPGEELSETADESNWYIRGRTQSTSFNAQSNVCGEFVGFRVEARDTILTYIQGASLGPLYTDSIDTLIFSTFSTVDTLYQVQAGFIPKPNFDTLRVLDNGDVYVRVDVANAGTIGDFEVYENTIAGTPLTVLERGIQDSAFLVGAGASSGTAVDFPGNGAIGTFNTYVMKAIDDCDASKTSDGEPFTTISPYGEMSSLCPPTFRLNWNKPEFGEYDITSYRIFMNGDQVATITDENTTTVDLPVLKGVSYEFQVIASADRLNNTPSINISAKLGYTVPSNLRSDEVVPGPDLRCSFVESNGSVTLTFDHPLDSTNNRTGYEFQHRVSGTGNWTTFGGSSLVDTGDVTVTITGINAQQQQYDFRAVSLSGCSGSETGAFGNEVSSIFLTATPRAGDRRKRGDIDWNNDAVSEVYDNSVHKNGEGAADPYTYNPVFRGEPVFIDVSNGPICDSTFDYYLDRPVDVFNADPTAPQTCMSRSNIATANYLDTIAPIAENFDYITYDLDDQQIVGRWSRSLSGQEVGDVDSLLITTHGGMNSGLQEYISLGAQYWDIANKEVNIPTSELDARDSSITLGTRSKDACGNISVIDSVIFHRSMDVNVRWSTCDSTMTVTWNPYEGFPKDSTIYYQIWYSNSGQTLNDFVDFGFNLGTQTDTTYVQKIDEGDIQYYYNIVASTDPDFGASSFQSRSNVEGSLASYDAEPRYGLITYATVLPTDQIEVEYYKDTLVPVNGYVLYRGTSKDNLRPLSFEDYDPIEDDESFTYVDSEVDVNSVSYYYQVVIENDCRIPIDTSNLGRTMFLSVKPDNEAMTNSLSWNRYEEWDSTVAYYNIYRGVDGEPSEEVYAVVTPTGRRTELYVDDVFDDVFSIGKFCYKVEAVQGSVSQWATEGIPNNIESARSMSNTSCITQRPLFYVPNAFAPDGINKTFGPKGQFFDFSLFEMVIYNRWGEEVYRTRDINKGWDGTYKGDEAQLGSYVYMIRFIDANGDEHRRKGTVTLLK